MVATVPMGTAPEGIAVNPVDARAHVTNLGGTGFPRCVGVNPAGTRV
jgi:DNA-binding beta-propeller fold protein YncE